MDSFAVLAKLQRIACADKLYKMWVEVLGPCQPSPNPRVGKNKYQEEIEELLAAYDTVLGKKEDDEAIAMLRENFDEQTDDNEDADIARLVDKIPLIHHTIKDYLCLDLERTAKLGATAIVFQTFKEEKAEMERLRREAALAEKDAPSIGADGERIVPARRLKMIPEEKHRLAFLVRQGLEDESVELAADVEDDIPAVEIELRDDEPNFLKGLAKRKNINYRSMLPSEQVNNAAPMQRQAVIARLKTNNERQQAKETNTMLLAAQSQAQRNRDRLRIKARDRRERVEQQRQEQDGDDALRDETPNVILDLDPEESKDHTLATDKAFSRQGKLPTWMKRALGSEKPSFGYRRSFTDIQEQRRSLPIYNVKDSFLRHVDEFPVTILVGETGSGKTTQIPQYLEEHGYARDGMMIAITQPRRVAAETLAKRVAEEYGKPCGQEVGYTVRFKDHTSSLTRIKYMTDGMLLREALVRETFDKYSVIILDEAHERSINTDVLFAVVKRAMQKRPSLKVVVTSATLDTDKFCEYFGAPPPFRVGGRTFEVEHYFLEQPTEDYVESAIHTVMMIHLKEGPGDVLVFLTGQEEIDNAGERLVKRMEELQKRVPHIPDLMVLPLTATMPEDVQSKVFEKTPPGVRKVVLATNVAETSITIDNLMFVVDSGFCKQNLYDAKKGMEQLKIVPISKAQSRQRAGRAGRIGPGKCYRLYTEDQFITDMEDTTVPEIQRSNLFNTVLQLKAAGFHDLFAFEFMDPPEQETLVNALQKLYYLGALDRDGYLTSIGWKMAQLPIDPSQAKTLLMAIEFKCVAPVLTIVSMLAVQRRGVFYRPRGKESLADSKKMAFHQPEGDQFTLMEVFDRWIDSGKSEEWAKTNFVKQKMLMEAEETRKQLESMLPREDTNRTFNEESKNRNQIRKALVAGYFFNAAKRTTGDFYVTLSDRREVGLHPSSSLREDKPRYVIFDELHMTTREYMREVMAIEPQWLEELAPSYYKKPAAGELTKEQRALRLHPILRSFENSFSWRISKMRLKK